MVHYNDKIFIQNIFIYLYKISIQNINYKTINYCFAIGPCTDSWLPTILNAPIYLDAFLLALNVSAVTVVNVPFFCFFLGLVLLEDAAIPAATLGVGAAPAAALGASAATEDAAGAAAATELPAGAAGAAATEDAADGAAAIEPP
jgi:hypothetical protein